MSDRIQIRQRDEESYNLTILGITEEDMGSYTCKAKNKGGDVSTSAKIIISGGYKSGISYCLRNLFG